MLRQTWQAAIKRFYTHDRPRRRKNSLGAPRIELLEGRITPSSVTLTPVADNTLYEDSTGNLSDGAGQHFYVGLSRQTDSSLRIRRGVIKFDLSSIPAGSTINSATLTLNVSKVPTGFANEDVVVHVAGSAWGEGTSDAATGGAGGGEGDGIQATTNDATWLNTFFNTQSWTNAGGDFAATASATTNVAGLGVYHWSSAGLAADLQQWLDNPATNFGWLLTGDEATQKSVKQFDSRQNSNSSTEPMLDIDYTAPPPDLTIAKTHSGNFTQGEPADTYKIVVANSGTGPTSGTVTVSDILPIGLQPTPADNNANLNGWNVSFSGQTITATRSDTLPVGNSFPDLNLTVSVDDTATNLTNTASVAGGGETDTSNDSSDDPTTIDLGHVNICPRIRCRQRSPAWKGRR